MRVLLDVDGVLADFATAVLTDMRHRLGKDHNIEEISEYNMLDCLGLNVEEKKLIIENCICAPGFAFGMKPYEGALDAVFRIAKKHDVIFVTSDYRSSPTWVYDRNRWLVKTFGLTIGRNVIHTSIKSVVRGDVLVEDKASTLVEWKMAYPKGIAILKDMPYNRGFDDKSHGIIRTHDWNWVEELLIW